MEAAPAGEQENCASGELDHHGDTVWARRRDVTPTSTDVKDVTTAPKADVTCDSLNSISEQNGITTNSHSENNSKHSTIEMKGDKSGAVYISMDKQIHTYPSAGYKRLEHPADKSLLSSFFLSIIFLLVALALFCPVMGLVLILVPVSWLVRRCVDCCCCTPQHVCTCCSAVMTNSDSYWLHDSATNHMVVQSLLVLEHGLDLTRIRELLQARLICAQAKNGRYLYPRFTHKLIELNTSWLWKCDTNFSIEDHIFNATSDIKTSRQLQEYVSDLANRPLDMSRPLWEIHVISDYGEEKDTVILFRMHPCMSDGVGMIRVLVRAVVDESLVPVSLKVNFASRAFYFNVIRALIVGPLVFFHKFIFTRTDYNIFHGANKLSENKIVVWSEAYSMASLTRIKQVARSAMNDVVLAALSGALRTYQQYHGVEHPFDMLATSPFDFRNEMHPSSKVRMGNYFALLDVPLPTNTEGAIPRLWEVRHRMEELKNSADVPIMHGIMTILMYVFPKCVAHFILDTIYNHTSCYISNLMGPTSEQTFAGRKIKDILYWVPPRADVALSINLITYGPQVRIAVLADRGVVPNPEIITQDFVAQIENYAKLLANRRIPGEHRHRGEHHSQEQQSDPEPSIEQLRKKMAEIQQQLQDHKAQLDTAIENKFEEDQENLTDAIENLRDEFRDLMIEIRRRRAQQEGGGILSDDDDDEDGELRRASMRRRTLSTASRRLSLVSYASMARPLTTSGLQHRNSISPPSSPANERLNRRRRSRFSIQPNMFRPRLSIQPRTFRTRTIPSNWTVKSTAKESDDVTRRCSVPDLRRHLVPHEPDPSASIPEVSTPTQTPKRRADLEAPHAPPSTDTASIRVVYKPSTNSDNSSMESDRQNPDDEGLL